MTGGGRNPHRPGPRGPRCNAHAPPSSSRGAARPRGPGHAGRGLSTFPSPLCANPNMRPTFNLAAPPSARAKSICASPAARLCSGLPTAQTRVLKLRPTGPTQPGARLGAQPGPSRPRLPVPSAVRCGSGLRRRECLLTGLLQSTPAHARPGAPPSSLSSPMAMIVTPATSR